MVTLQTRKCFLNPIRNFFLKELDKVCKIIRNAIVMSMTSALMDKILLFFLNAIRLLFKVLPAYRKEIKGFKAKIAIKSLDSGMHVTVFFKRVGLFRRPGLMVLNSIPDDVNVTLIFKDGSAMADFLLSGNPDIIAGILDSKLSFTGNINYLYRFVYLIRHIPIELGFQFSR